MTSFSIAPVSPADFDDWLEMAMELWPDYTRQGMAETLTIIAQSDREEAFICRSDDGSAAGFMNLSVRRDYVEGSSTSPVGYVEGIYVREPYRKRGLARRLVETAEKWTADQGLTELASDAELDNVDSHAFHEAVGFEEANRTVNFVKDLG